LLRPIGEIEIRNVAVGNARRRILSFEIDDAFRVRKRKRTKENAVNQAEDGGIRADAEPRVRIAIAANAGAFANWRSA
jgi:hypothetical protein